MCARGSTTRYRVKFCSGVQVRMRTKCARGILVRVAKCVYAYELHAKRDASWNKTMREGAKRRIVGRTIGSQEPRRYVK